jgi:GT2 family glycosyltransferase
MYFEETHLCVQMQRRGWKLWVDDQARAYHHVRSQEDRIPAKHFAFYFARNNLYFWKTCFGIPAWIQLPRTALVILKELLLPLRRARSFPALLANLRWTWAGFWDGFAFLKVATTPRERRLFPELAAEAPSK